MTRFVLALFALFFLAAPAAAQTPAVIRVLGVGQVAMDVDTATLAEAQAQGYRAYVGTAAAIVLTVTCTGAARPFVCVFPLAQIQSALSPTAARSLAVAAFVSAADGERESARASAPFTLQQAAPPVAPTAGAMSVRPPA
jgi:hypothetical protein